MVRQLGDDLPTEAALDALAVLSWDECLRANARSLDDDTMAGPASLLPAVVGENVLGERLPSVPAELHDQIEKMAWRGVLPVTSTEQRERQRGTAGSANSVPDVLRAALTHGYIGPNLPLPRGLVWRNDGRVWKLCHRGG